MGQIETSYARACRQIAQQTGIDIFTFPTDCPYKLMDTLDENWLPSEWYQNLSQR